MANKKKTTNKRTKKVVVPPGPSHPFDLDRFKNMVIIALVAIITGISAAFLANVYMTKERLITSEQQTYLHVFPELAANFVQNLDINENRETAAQIKDYGISKTDGAFYIVFDYYFIDEVNPDAPEETPKYTGTVYFWEDKERPGHYSYAFSYE